MKGVFMFITNIKLTLLIFTLYKHFYKNIKQNIGRL